jgi:outer membrane biosynthesis protein TonB
MRYPALLSGALHLIVLLLLIVTFQWTPPVEPPTETAFAVDFTGAAQSAKSLRQGKVAASTEAKEAEPKPPAVAPPTKAPIEAPPPPPPPPPQAPSAADAPTVPTPPAPTPPPELTPLPAPTTPPPPAPPKQLPAQSVSQTPAQTITKLVLPPSRTTQPNPTKTAVADSKTLENTLEKLRALQDQKTPPKALYNPDSGGAPDAGGSLNGNDTSKLTTAERGAIGAHVRQCWDFQGGTLNGATFVVRLRVVTDGDGTVHIAEVAGPDRARMNADPVFRSFAERAVRAVLSPQCSSLPLPKSMLGKNQTLEFNFRP